MSLAASLRNSLNLIIKDYRTGNLGGGNPLEHILLWDQKPFGTEGGGGVVGLNTRTFNTIVNDPTEGLVLNNPGGDSTQFTLPAGNYGFIRIDTIGYRCNRSRLHLYDVTNSQYVASGITNNASEANVASTFLNLNYIIGTLESPTTYEIRHYVSGNHGGAVQLLGVNAVGDPTGRPNIYTTIDIEYLGE